jgi:hypothetical protein
MPTVNSIAVDPTVGGTHLTDLGMWKQASYWSAAIPKFEALAEDSHGDLAAGPVALPVKGGGRLSFEAEAQRSNQHVSQSNSFTDPKKVRPADGTTTAPGAVVAALNGSGSRVDPGWVSAAQFVGGRGFSGEPRNSTYNRLPDSAKAAVSDAVWQLSEMSTGEYLRFTTDSHHVTLRWALRTVCAEKWVAGCHLATMPDSGTSAFDTYAWDPTNSTWRHYPNNGLHYAESGSAAFIKPEKLDAGNVTYLVYLPLRNGEILRCVRAPPRACALVYCKHARAPVCLDLWSGCMDPSIPPFIMAALTCNSPCHGPVTDRSSTGA